MKWTKKGLICSYKTFDLNWYKKNTMVPIPWLLNNNTLRIFITMCDKDNVGRIGYVDVNPNNPSEILGFSKEPVLDIGAPGTFDDNGVIVGSIINHKNKLIMYYSGYQLCQKTPYFIFTGLATADNATEKFTRFQKTPILDRTKAEIAIRSAPFVIKDNNIYKMWYNADYGDVWTQNEAGKVLPMYLSKYITSDNPYVWNQKEGQQCFNFGDKEEYAIAMPTVWLENNIYKMIYSVRTFDKGYRLGYAESQDGINFVRMDDKMDIDVSSNGWDSEMMCFGNRFQYQDKIYLFYCGNGYGLGGFGYAELMEK